MKSVAAILLLLVARITAQASVCKDVAPGNEPSTDPSPFLIEVVSNHGTCGTRTVIDFHLLIIRFWLHCSSKTIRTGPIK